VFRRLGVVIVVLAYVLNINYDGPSTRNQGPPFGV
jgi:hypothetical protein